MELKREYIVIMVEDDGTELYNYFDNENDSLKYAKKVSKNYVGVGVKLVDYESDIEYIIWESGNNEK